MAKTNKEYTSDKKFRFQTEYGQVNVDSTIKIKSAELKKSKAIAEIELRINNAVLTLKDGARLDLIKKCLGREDEGRDLPLSIVDIPMPKVVLPKGDPK